VRGADILMDGDSNMSTRKKYLFHFNSKKEGDQYCSKQVWPPLILRIKEIFSPLISKFMTLGSQLK
jgi:hypothetical protein